MNVTLLKYAVLLVGLAAPLAAHAEMGDPNPDMHGNGSAPILLDTTPTGSIDSAPTGSIQAAPPCDPRKHGHKKPVKCPPRHP
jgi:hypothetical protein